MSRKLSSALRSRRKSSGGDPPVIAVTITRKASASSGLMSQGSTGSDSIKTVSASIERSSRSRRFSEPTDPGLSSSPASSGEGGASSYAETKEDRRTRKKSVNIPLLSTSPQPPPPIVEVGEEDEFSDKRKICKVLKVCYDVVSPKNFHN